MIRAFNITEHNILEGDARFKNHPKVDIFYQDMIRDPDITFKLVTDFLGVEYHKPDTTLKKQNPERLSDLISNFSELREAFEETKWCYFFNE